MESLYDILGVPNNATEEQIRKAYRIKAKQYHPDINRSPDANHHFIRLKRAYEILSNNSTRNEYNRRRSAAENNPMSSFEAYEAWKQREKAKREYEEWKRQQEFLRNRERFRNSWLYKPTKVFIFLATGFCYLFGAFMIAICFYVAYKTHFLVLLLLLPFICGGGYFIKLTKEWYLQSKRYF